MLVEIGQATAVVQAERQSRRLQTRAKAGMFLASAAGAGVRPHHEIDMDVA